MKTKSFSAKLAVALIAILVLFACFFGLMPGKQAGTAHAAGDHGSHSGCITRESDSVSTTQTVCTIHNSGTVSIDSGTVSGVDRSIYNGDPLMVSVGITAVIVVLSAVAIGLGVFVAMLALKLKRGSEKAAETAQDKPDNAEATEQIDADAVPETAREAVAVAAEEETGEEEGDTAIIEDKYGNKIIVNYNRSLTARIIQASDETKEYYCELANAMLSLKGVKARLSWKALTFNVGRKQLCKLTMRGKTLNAFFALSPDDYTEAKFKIFDKRDSKTYAAVPLNIKVKTPRGLNNARKLIADLAAVFELAAVENKPVYAAADYPYEDTKTLIGRELIKVRSLDGKEITDVENLVARPFELHKSITVSEAKRELSDEAAMAMVEKLDQTNAAPINVNGKKYAVNIDVLSQSFESGDTVDIAALKAKGIVPKKETAVKILARGKLDKPLTVIADGYSADAVKMIVLVGGIAKSK